MRWMLRKINCNAIGPRWMGVAWVENHRSTAVWMPLGLNVLARWVRLAWLHVKFGQWEWRGSCWLEGYEDGQRVAAGRVRRALADLVHRTEQYLQASDTSIHALNDECQMLVENRNRPRSLHLMIHADRIAERVQMDYTLDHARATLKELRAISGASDV